MSSSRPVAGTGALVGEGSVSVVVSSSPSGEIGEASAAEERAAAA